MPDDNFKWVKERFRCSLGEVFEALKTEVDQDVKEREEVLQPPDRQYCVFRFRTSDRSFTAWIEGPNIHKSVDFKLEDGYISVRKNGEDKIIRATTTLSDEGRCVLKIDNKEREYERWQLRKLALEDLFFNFI